MSASVPYRLRWLIPSILLVLAMVGSLTISAFQLRGGLARARQEAFGVLEVQAWALRNSLSDLLMRDELELAERRFTDAMLDPGIQTLVFVDASGLVRFSTQRQWIGGSREAVDGFVPAEARQVQEEHRDYLHSVDATHLVGYFPVPLGPASGALRADSEGLLFVACDMGPSLAKVRHQMMLVAVWSLGFWTIAALLLFVLLDQLVTRKVIRLIDTINKIEQGHQGARSGLSGADELSRLGAAFDLLQDQAEAGQKELRASNALSQTLVESLPLMLFLKDARDLRFVQFNKAGEELLGLARAEMIGKNVHDLYPTEQAQAFEAMDRTVLDGQRCLDIPEEPVLTRHLGTRFFHTIKVPILDDQGAPRYLLGLSEDITDQKRARESLRTAFAAMEQSPVGIVITDAVGVIEFVNQSYLATSGYSAEEVLGQTPRVFKSGETSQEDYQAIWATLLAGKIWQGRFHNKRKDGSLWWEQDTIAPIHNDREETTHFVAVKQDLTVPLQMEAERRQLELQLTQAQKLESLGSLAGGVAHDMNNVLAAILSMASIHQQAAPEGSALRRSLDTIEKACLRGRTLVQGLLGIARKGLLENRPLDLNSLVREQVLLLERTTFQKIRLEMHLAEDLHSAMGDVAALTHALMNICINAVDAMPEGGTLTFTTRNEGDDALVLEVSDTGEGMSPDVLERAMEPFFSTKPHGKGTGLGLSLVHATVKAHQGRVVLESRPGIGTMVRISLPAAQRGVEVAGTSTAAPTPGRSRKVLVVDDDELLQQSTMQILDLLGHHASLAECGETAIRMLENGLEVDAVLLDLNMPGMGGAAALPRIRQLRPQAPVFITTGRTDEKALGLVQQFPGVRLLAKPYALADLKACLES